LVLTKALILSRLREQVKGFLSTLEECTGLEIQFEALPQSNECMSEYRFIIPDKPRIGLRADWEDVDVAHELMHMKLELVEGYSVLAWRRNCVCSDSVQRAFGRIRNYTDDEVVHARLGREFGFKVDGQVVRSQLFEKYAKAKSKLKKGRARYDDEMTALDDTEYGELCRSAFLLQAYLIQESYHKELEPPHLKRLKGFIDTFETYLDKEAAKAKGVYALFRVHDVQSVEGHKQILQKWAQMEGLDRFVGITSYQRCETQFSLPYPED
jgi:hypothetical protein